MTGPGTNTYIVGQKQVVIIDPGPNNSTHLDNIVAALATLKAQPQSVIVTHPHPDHDGCAQILANYLNVALLRFNHSLQHSDTVPAGSMTLQAYHTPGHIYAHLCFLVREQNILLAADLVAGEGTILIIPPDGDMAAYLDSLQAMKTLAPALILPGHGPVIKQPQTLLQEYIDHRLAREQEVLHWLAQGYTSARAIASQIYTDRPPQVLGIATMQVEAHLEKIRQEELD